MRTVKIDNSEIFYAITRHNEVPSKYSYLGEGARYWDKLTEAWSNSGVNTNAEAQLLQTNSKQIIETVRSFGFFKPSDIHVIDLGCGNGEPASIICSQMPSCMYTAADISSEMIEIALKEIRLRLSGSAECSSFVLDFETQSPKQIVDELCDSQHTNLFIFVGNTLGNYSNPHEIISGIVGAMSDRDFLLVGNGLVPSGPNEDAVRAYDRVEERELLTSATERLGIPLSEVRFVWSGENEVQAISSISEDIVVEHYSQRVLMKSGTELLLLRSRKYSPQNLSNLLTSAGITIVSKWVNLEKTNMLALCKPMLRMAR